MPNADTLFTLPTAPTPTIETTRALELERQAKACCTSHQYDDADILFILVIDVMLATGDDKSSTESTLSRIFTSRSYLQYTLTPMPPQSTTTIAARTRAPPRTTNATTLLTLPTVPKPTPETTLTLEIKRRDKACCTSQQYTNNDASLPWPSTSCSLPVTPTAVRIVHYHVISPLIPAYSIYWQMTYLICRVPIHQQLQVVHQISKYFSTT